jgi:hypothetical protein
MSRVAFGEIAGFVGIVGCSCGVGSMRPEERGRHVLSADGMAVEEGILRRLHVTAAVAGVASKSNRYRPWTSCWSSYC